MTYTIDINTTLYPLIDEEVSHVADQAYSESGVSLYDSVVLTSKDAGLVDRFIDDAVSQLIKRESDIAALSNGTLTFSVPDLDSSQEAAISAEITRYISMYASAGIFQQRRAELVPEYTRRTTEALDNIRAMLRKRTAPSRS